MKEIEQYKKIYITGPITGMEDFNRPAFGKATEMFRRLGKFVTNPHEIVPLELIEKHIQEPKKLWTEAMKICLRAITTQDAVFVLDGWNSSRGSVVEIFLAQTLSIPVYYFKDLTEFSISFQITKHPRGII